MAGNEKQGIALCWGRIWLGFSALFCPQEGQGTSPSTFHRILEWFGLEGTRMAGISSFSCQEVISWFSSRGGNRITCSSTELLAQSFTAGRNEGFQENPVFIDACIPKSISCCGCLGAQGNTHIKSLRISPIKALQDPRK